MFYFQVPQIVGGTVLVISDIRSQNFVTTVSGWIIRADGTAEFANVIIRGSLITSGDPHIEIPDVPGDEIQFHSNDPDVLGPGHLQIGLSGGSVFVDLRPPTTNGPPLFARIRMFNSLTIDDSLIEFQANRYTWQFPNAVALELSEDTTPATDQAMFSHPDNWHVVGTGGEPAFAGAWTSPAGTFGALSFTRDIDGYVTIRGSATAGAVGTIFTLPVGYRPPVNQGFAASGNNAFARITVGSLGTVSLVVGAPGAAGLLIEARFATF